MLVFANKHMDKEIDAIVAFSQHFKLPYKRIVSNSEEKLNFLSKSVNNFSTLLIYILHNSA